MDSHNQHESLVRTGQNPEELFCLEELLGEGSYGKVYKATRIQTGIKYAIKIVNTAWSEMENLQKEIRILSDCASISIVKYQGSYFYNDQLWLVMEYCEIGSVNDLIKASPNALATEPHIAAILKGILLGLSYLHSHKKIHRDIKAANVLLNAKGQVKLADFGVSAQLMHTQGYIESFIGTPFWMSPEVLNSSKYNSKTDIWSLGVTAIEMAEGQPPNSNLSQFRAIMEITKNPPRGLTTPQRWSLAFNKFVQRCLTVDADSRPTSEELLLDPFIASVSDEYTTILLSSLVQRNLPHITAYRKKLLEKIFAQGKQQQQQQISSNNSNKFIKSSSNSSSQSNSNCKINKNFNQPTSIQKIAQVISEQLQVTQSQQYPLDRINDAQQSMLINESGTIIEYKYQKNPCDTTSNSEFTQFYGGFGMGEPSIHQSEPADEHTESTGTMIFKDIVDDEHHQESSSATRTSMADFVKFARKIEEEERRKRENPSSSSSHSTTTEYLRDSKKNFTPITSISSTDDPPFTSNLSQLEQLNSTKQPSKSPTTISSTPITTTAITAVMPSSSSSSSFVPATTPQPQTGIIPQISSESQKRQEIRRVEGDIQELEIEMARRIELVKSEFLPRIADLQHYRQQLMLPSSSSPQNRQLPIPQSNNPTSSSSSYTPVASPATPTESNIITQSQPNQQQQQQSNKPAYSIDTSLMTSTTSLLPTTTTSVASTPIPRQPLLFSHKLKTNCPSTPSASSSSSAIAALYADMPLPPTPTQAQKNNIPQTKTNQIQSQPESSSQQQQQQQNSQSENQSVFLSDISKQVKQKHNQQANHTTTSSQQYTPTLSNQLKQQQQFTMNSQHHIQTPKLSTAFTNNQPISSVSGLSFDEALNRKQFFKRSNQASNNLLPHHNTSSCDENKLIQSQKQFQQIQHQPPPPHLSHSTVNLSSQVSPTSLLSPSVQLQQANNNNNNNNNNNRELPQRPEVHIPPKQCISPKKPSEIHAYKCSTPSAKSSMRLQPASTYFNSNTPTSSQSKQPSTPQPQSTHQNLFPASKAYSRLPQKQQHQLHNPTEPSSRTNSQSRIQRIIDPQQSRSPSDRSHTKISCGNNNNTSFMNQQNLNAGNSFDGPVVATTSSQRSISGNLLAMIKKPTNTSKVDHSQSTSALPQNDLNKSAQLKPRQHTPSSPSTKSINQTPSTPLQGFSFQKYLNNRFQHINNY